MSTVRPEHLNELQRSLEALRDLTPRIPDGLRWTSDATTARHIAFHTAEAADFWLRNVILGEPRPRDRDAEFTVVRDPDTIAGSIDAAIAACETIAQRTPPIEAPVAPPPSMTEGRPWTVLDALLHITAHTAAHLGELTVAIALSR